MKSNSKVTQIGLDCHRKFSNATARNAEGKVVWRQRLDHRDREVLRERLREWPEETPVILEATFGWGWISDELRACSLDPHLANSRKVAGWRKALGLAKTNRVDADLLSELWSQQRHWWEVWLAPGEVRSQREWFRYRSSLVKMQTTLKNRIHAVLHRHGVVNEHSDLFGTQGRRFLQQQLEETSLVSEMGRRVLQGNLRLLDQVRRQVAAATKEIQRFVRRTPEARRLRTLPGVSYILAHTILAEIGKIDRFAGSRKLVAYSLLAPLANETGDPDDDPPQGRHVGCFGRRTLKWAFIEASHSAIRKGGRLRAIYDQRTDGGKRNRNRGCIAVARELCRITYAMLRYETDYSGEPPARPGSKIKSSKKRRKSRPGTGQLDTAMVDAPTVSGHQI